MAKRALLQSVVEQGLKGVRCGVGGAEVFGGKEILPGKSQQ